MYEETQAIKLLKIFCDIYCEDGDSKEKYDDFAETVINFLAGYKVEIK